MRSWRRMTGGRESSGIPAKRIFERLRDEHGYSGGITIDRDRAAGHKHLALLPKPCPSYEPAEGGIPRGTPSFPQPAVKQ